MFLLKVKYRIRYYWWAFIELCGYCKYCGSKKSSVASGRTICTNINCRS